MVQVQTWSNGKSIFTHRQGPQVYRKTHVNTPVAPIAYHYGDSGIGMSVTPIPHVHAATDGDMITKNWRIEPWNLLDCDGNCVVVGHICTDMSEVTFV